MVKWWHFWNPQSGLIGGVIGSAIIWTIIAFIMWAFNYYV